VIFVGASAGGVCAVIELLSRLPADLPAFIGVAIHRSPGSTSDWSEVREPLIALATILGDGTGDGVVETQGERAKVMAVLGSRSADFRR